MEALGQLLVNRQPVDHSVCAAPPVAAKCARFCKGATPASSIFQWPEGGHAMRRKPDLLWVLVFLFGLGIVTTGYAQSFWGKSRPAPLDAAYSVPLR